MTDPVSVDSAAELAALVHSLEVHQTELEVQNHELVATIDELRRSNAALELARDRYQALYDLAPVALVTIDRGGTILDGNEAAAATLEAPREHVVGRRLAMFVIEAERLAIRDHIETLFSTGALHDHGACLGHLAGAAREVRLHGIVLREAGPARAVVAIVDVSAVRAFDLARRELEKRVERRRREDSLTTLAGGVAHDFNNFLTVVIAGAQHIREQLGAESPVSETIDDVHRAACGARALAYQMLAYSGRLSTAPRLTEPAELIGELEPTLRAIANTTPLIIALADDLPRLRCATTQIRQLLVGLVRNAVEAMTDRPGAVALTVRETSVSEASVASLALRGALEPGAHLVLEVRDDGVGMDADVQARAFEPFFSTKSVGRGLGLAVIDGIVRGHHGAIAIESALGRGTVVRVYIPAFPRPISSVATELRAPGPRAQRIVGTVLVVDDDVEVRRTLNRVLTSLGLVVVVAADGLEAVARFRAEPGRFDAVLLDLKMPGMDGAAAGAAIHALQPEVPLALISALNEIAGETDSVFAATLAKPFDLAQLREMITTLLAGNRRRSE